VGGYDQVFGPWANNFAAAWTHAKYTRPTLLIGFANSAATAVSYRFNSPYDPVVTQVSGPAIDSPASYSFSTKSAYSNTTANTTEKTIKDDLRRDFTFDGHPTYVKFGGDYRTKATNLDGSKWNITKTPWALNADSVYPGADVQDTQGGFPNLRIRQEYVQSFYKDSSGYGLVFDPKTTYGAAFVGHEDITSGYGQAGITLGHLNATTGAIKPVSNKSNYTNVLPSAVLTYEADPRTILRASWSQTIGRPDYSSLAPGRAVDDAKKTVSQGNVNLPPLQANNWDASVEHYYGHLGVVSAAVFYKTIKNFTYSGLAGTDPDTGYTLTSFLTAPSAWIHGVELNWRQQLYFLPGPLAGLGFQANTIIGNSHVTYPTRPGENLRFPGYGHKLGNFALTYERAGLSLRAAIHFHDNRVLARSTIGANSTQDEMEPFYKQIDVSAGYKFSEHWRVYASISNLNTAPLQTYWGGTAGLTRIDTLERYGWGGEGGITWSY
jgi:outer membrane receptor protein involved in Fe transport